MASFRIRLLFRFLLFVSSYFPAFLILFLLQLDRNLWIALGILGFGALGLLGLGTSLIFLRRLEPRFLKVERRRGQESEIMSYVVTYLIPFVTGMIEDGGSTESILACVVFFLVVGPLYANSNMIQVNPMLSLIGYRVFRIDGEDADPTFLITRRDPPRGAQIRAAPLGEDIFLEV